jgi:hypothetical protein
MMSSASTHEVKKMNTSKPMLPVFLLLCMLCIPVMAAPVNDTTKAIIISFQYRDGTVTPAGSRVIYGYPPDNIANSDLLAELAGKSGTVIGSYGIEDPRVLYSDTGAVLESDVRFSVILPFSAAGDHVDLFDGQTKQKLATADITGAMTTFCSAHRDDPDCGGGGTPLLLYGAGLLVLVIIGAGIYLLMKRQKPAA